jgi:hypothetical protein
MDSRRRLVYYILINIFVSVLVTGTLIYFYDRIRPTDCETALPNAMTVSPGVGDVNVNIVGVIGAGTVADEQIIVQNDGSQELLLTGWYLKDDKGVTYTFPQLTLYPGAKVQVHTKSGADKLPDLYWGREAPVWTSGELAAIYDAQNIARAFYRVP